MHKQIYVNLAVKDLKRSIAFFEGMVLEGALGPGPYFDSERFSIVDAVFGPVFRYFDTFERIGDFHFFDAALKVRAWRRTLAARHSVRHAVGDDYGARLLAFIESRGSELSRRVHLARERGAPSQA